MNPFEVFNNPNNIATPLPVQPHMQQQQQPPNTIFNTGVPPAQQFLPPINAGGPTDPAPAPKLAGDALPLMQAQTNAPPQTSHQQVPETFHHPPQVERPHPGTQSPPSNVRHVPAPQDEGAPSSAYSFASTLASMNKPRPNGPRKKALLIGINYFQTKYELKGCINDVANIKEFLKQHGYDESPETMCILTDDNGEARPLRENLIEAMKWLVHDAQPGDNLFFHYSGHGGLKEDTTGDEASGYDETIMPLDFKKTGEIIDDDLHTMLVKPLIAGVHMVAVFDSCHSGTALDLPWIYRSNGTHKTPGISVMKFGEGALDAGVQLLEGRSKAAAAAVGKILIDGIKAKLIGKKNKKENSSDASVIMISGCKDDQTSADATVDGFKTGALSFALIHTLKEKHDMPLVELLNKMRDIMFEKQFEQIPQMSTSHKMEPDTIFMI
eukprot:TRINITY_DN11304_c0_g1_i1.p1 TRINITY_DN11304_c0_g1~~TRINITY_DN11304_c0_g1_i1.p1  ORF type:complete len:451 (-),score=114.73 TRINITY_DN11304_c0_g1_i1:86-1402(-)